MGKVHLIAGGKKIYADIAARFCRSEKSVTGIIESPYTPEIIRNILASGHLAALEFDYFLFGVEGFSRVCEVQLVRKRMASYMIKSGREELGGKRKFDVHLPENVRDFSMIVRARLPVPDERGRDFARIQIDADDICRFIGEWYEFGRQIGRPEEDLRYMKPEGTTFRGIIGMNAHSLWDFFAQRMCRRAQDEIRDMATQMHRLAMEAAPDLFAGSGPKCVQLGYCPENGRQAEWCRANRAILTKDRALEILREHSVREKAHDDRMDAAADSLKRQEEGAAGKPDSGFVDRNISAAMESLREHIMKGGKGA